MGLQYVVKRGDCLSRIAQQFGFSSYRTLYDAPENADFKAKRPDPNLIYPGDVINIPEAKTSPAQVKTGDTKELTVKVPAIIEAVGFVEDAEVRESLSDTPTQFVNLKHDAKWVDGTLVKSIDRLGQKPRIKVRFNKPGKHKFKLTIEPDPGNAVYSSAELGRNVNYKHETAAKQYTTGDDGTAVVEDLQISCAGGDRFAFVASGDGTSQKSSVLGGQRLLYLQELKMTGAPAATSLTAASGELAKAGIRVVSLPSVAMDRMENVSDSAADNTKLKQNVHAAYGSSGAKAKEPYVIAIAYTDQLAVKEAITYARANAQAGPGQPDVNMVLLDDSGVYKRCLWNEIVTGESWFISASFRPNGGSPVALSAADVTAVPRVGAPQALQEVNVKLSGLPAATGTITLKVYCVNRMRTGVSLGAGNLVCICTRVWWRTFSDSQQNGVIVHEIGHQLGLVPDGSGKGLDRTPNQFVGKGYNGSHCHAGLQEMASYANQSGSCVMFGASEHLAYCPDCAMAARKVDMSAGRAAF